MEHFLLELPEYSVVLLVALGTVDLTVNGLGYHFVLEFRMAWKRTEVVTRLALEERSEQEPQGPQELRERQAMDRPMTSLEMRLELVSVNRPAGLFRRRPLPQKLDRLNRPVSVVMMERLVANRPEWWKEADWDQEQENPVERKLWPRNRPAEWELAYNLP